MKKHRFLARNRALQNIIVLCIALGIAFSGLFIVWLSTLKIPDLGSFDKRRVLQSTKILDRNGILLYDIHENTKRTVVPFEDISRNAKNATVAIEDPEFYDHLGIKPKAILRAVIANLKAGEYSQGGSTITQQVVKNTILTGDKTLTRKLKEWVLALKLERSLSKEQILSLYLNEMPFGGSVYGIEEASRSYFGKSAKDISLAESAYLAAMLRAPTYYSPYGKHKKELTDRHNLVLKKMLENEFITDSEFTKAQGEEISFQVADDKGIRAPHFVFYVRDYLMEKYGESMVEEGGLKVTTTLDYALQQKAEEIVKKDALRNAVENHATNAALTAIDPKTGQVLVMVGSRDYFDKSIEGNFNVATAFRQPGSSFKPFVYATAFNKGYTQDTVLFDLKTQFVPSCGAENMTSEDGCYSPGNYDDKTRGPMTLRNALAQSINIPAVKLLYLTGVQESLNTAKDMGVESLGDASRYGLSLVLGGADVSLLEMTSAYGVFANDGIRNPSTPILKIEDNKGNIIEQYESNPKRILPENTARIISSILSDNAARAPVFGVNSKLNVPGRQVAAKTGTTNDYRDTWILGYTPQIVVGAWAGNNDNSSIEKKVAGLVVAPTWNTFITEVLKNLPEERFSDPEPVDPAIKPILRGVWTGGTTYIVDKLTGAQATENTPPEFREERVVRGVHSILYWVDKDDPQGEAPSNPANDPQFPLWEWSVRNWALNASIPDEGAAVVPVEASAINTTANTSRISFISPNPNVRYNRNEKLIVTINYSGVDPLSKMDIYLNEKFVGSSTGNTFSFTPRPYEKINEDNKLRAIVTDTAQKITEGTVRLKLE
ncbi:MAG TPA: PBP1A family penicillin-binding protein [Candidatus Paceibacterota bacterium]